MTIITLLTDFGLQDGYPGIMKGVILQISPRVKIVDLTHLISPQNILEGAVALSRSYRYFPHGTIHVAVIDPGVGTSRRPIALHVGEHFFIGPDNGLFTPILAEARDHSWPIEIRHLSQSKFWLPDRSNVFHGRDVFAPVAAHLAAGVPFSELGDLIDDPLTMDFPVPQVRQDHIIGCVIAIDHFGNLSTNILDAHLARFKNVLIRVGEIEIHGMVSTFGDASPGELVAMIGTDHDLCVAVVNGNAASQFNIGIGTEVSVWEATDR